MHVIAIPYDIIHNMYSTDQLQGIKRLRFTRAQNTRNAAFDARLRHVQNAFAKFANAFYTRAERVRNTNALYLVADPYCMHRSS